MKSIKDLREDYNLITEKEEHDMNKLTQLVRAGLFDAKKLSALKRAMEKPADKMTAQEKRMLINLLDALMSEVLSDKQVYRKIKQDVMMKESKDNFVSDPRFGRGYPSQKDVPSVLLLKRKAIRVFPDGQKVALYYAQAIDKYVSIPFSEIGINEEIELTEYLRKPVAGVEGGGTEGHRDYNPWKGGGGGFRGSGGSGVQDRMGYKDVLKPGSNTQEIIPSKPKIGGGQVRVGRGTGKLSLSKNKRIRSQVQDMVKKYKDTKGKKSKNPYSEPVPKIETTKKTDLPQRQVDKKLQTEKLPSVTGRTRIADRLKAAKDRSKNPFRKTQKGKKQDKKSRGGAGTALALGAAALLGGLGSGSGSNNEPKYFTPMNPKLQATAVAPTRTTSADSRAERERQASFRASKAMTQNESVDLDGNVFELNNKAVSKVKTLYESLNKKNKKKMVDMMKESNDSLQKVIAFAVRQ